MNNYKPEPQVAQENNFLQKCIYNQSMTINDLKIFKAILSKVKCNDSLFQDSYLIDYSTLDIAGVPKRNRFREVEKSLVKLMNTFVTIRKEDREKVDSDFLKAIKGDRTIGLIRNDFIHDKKTSKLLVTISEVLKPFFLELANKEYTIYSLKNISKFKNIYELKLYELFAKWKNRGFFNITIENLREYLEIEDNKHVRYTNFKSRVLEKAIKKISTTTNLQISYRELKINGDIIVSYGVGNKVNSLEFNIIDIEKISFKPEEYIGKFFIQDKREYLILDIEEVDDDKLAVQLFDKEFKEITNLQKPILINDFISQILL